MMLTPSTDYTDRDFDSLKLRLQNLVTSVFPEWSDFNDPNFGNLLLELMAFVGDVLAHLQDNQALNSRFVTATQRRALLAMVKLINYSPATASAATADVTLTLSSVPAGSVTIPAGTFVSSEEVTSPTRYQLLEEAVIAAAASPPTVTVSAEHSVSRSETFVSDGLGGQETVLSWTPYLDDSAEVEFGDGVYSQVDNFYSSDSDDRHFTVTVDQNDRATLRFGNGVNGTIPSGDGEVSYKTGGGVSGRVEAGALVNVEGSFFDSLGNPVRVSSTNASKSSGGYDRESLTQIKTLAPLSLRTSNRTVAREDFEINALRVPGVSRAFMLTSNEDVGIQENRGILLIIPEGGGDPSTALKAAVLTMVTVTYPCTLTFQVSVQNPVYKAVNVLARIAVANGYAPATAAASVRAALAAFFAESDADGVPNTNVDFGGKVLDNEGNVSPELAFSDVHNAVRDVAGVRKVVAGQFLLNGSAADVTLTTREFPTLGTVTLIDDATGLAV